MINLTAMIGRITGKSAESSMPLPGAPASGEAGSAASAGAFAALVQLVGRTEQAAEPLDPAGNSGMEIPDSAIGVGEGVAPEAMSDEAGAALPHSAAVTSWTQLASARVTPHKAATPPNAGLRAAPEEAAEAAPAIASDSAPMPDDDKITPHSRDRPIELPSGPAPADPVIVAINSPETTAITAEVRQNPAAVAKPSESRDVAEMPDGDGAVPLIVTGPQVATAVEARPRVNVKFSTPPAMPGKMEADGMVSGKVGDGTEPGVPGAIGLPGRRSEQAGSESPPLSPGSGAAGSAMPLRMIVESLPPVVQSALAAGTVATVGGVSTGQQLGDQVIDMAVSGQWIDRMAREITALAEGGGHSRFTLNPPHLGRLQVDLWQGPGRRPRRITDRCPAGCAQPRECHYREIGPAAGVAA